MDIYEINKNLQNEFALKKIKADAIANNNQAKANSHKGYAKLKALEREITFSLAQKQSEEKPNKKEIKQLEENLKQTREEIRNVLASLDLTEEDLKPKYECQICKDSGFVAGKQCVCFKRRKNIELIKACGLNANELCSFDDFNEKIYCDDKTKNDALMLKDFLSKWCEAYPNVTKKQIVLCGEVGVGKTFFTKCMAKSLIKKDFSVCFVSAFEMNNIMLKYHTTFDDSKLSILIPLLESDILFIDDLGTEPIINNVTLNYLFLVLSERERFNKPVIITTNLSPANLRDRYDERIFSRITNKQTSTMLKLEGDDLRQVKL